MKHVTFQGGWRSLEMQQAPDQKSTKEEGSLSCLWRDSCTAAHSLQRYLHNHLNTLVFFPLLFSIFPLPYPFILIYFGKKNILAHVVKGKVLILAHSKCGEMSWMCRYEYKPTMFLSLALFLHLVMPPAFITHAAKRKLPNHDVVNTKWLKACSSVQRLCFSSTRACKHPEYHSWCGARGREREELHELEILDPKCATVNQGKVLMTWRSGYLNFWFAQWPPLWDPHAHQHGTKVIGRRSIRSKVNSIQMK